MVTTHLLVSSLVLAAVGLPGNSLIMCVMFKSVEKLTTAEVLIVHLSVANMMHLFSRILTIVIPDQQGTCYPMTAACKVTILGLCLGRGGSMLFTLMLGVFRLMKLKNQGRILRNTIQKNTLIPPCLILTWILLSSVCSPYSLSISESRPSHHNCTDTCTCSTLDTLTDKDTKVKIFDTIFGTVTQVLAVILMSGVSINILYILLKHQKTVDVTLTSSRRNQHGTNAMKGIAALLVCYIICNVIDTLLRNFSSCLTFTFRKIVGDIYAVVSPFILGLGYPKFRRKLFCMRCGKICQKPIEQQTVTIS